MTQKMTAKTLIGLKAAEAELARKDSREALDVSFLPKGHPLREVAEKQKKLAEEMGQDLPPGHPLLAVLEQAKKRYEQGQELRTQMTERVQTRRARRLDQKKVEWVEREKEEESFQERRNVIQEVNAAMNDAVVAVTRVADLLGEHKDILSETSYTSMMSGRIGRIVNASMRGLSDMRFSLTRVTHNG